MRNVGINATGPAGIAGLRMPSGIARAKQYNGSGPVIQSKKTALRERRTCNLCRLRIVGAFPYPPFRRLSPDIHPHWGFHLHNKAPALVLALADEQGAAALRRCY
jgi:hypothetical protein